MLLSIARPRGALEIVQWLGLGLAVLGITWTFWPIPNLDTDYFPVVHRRAFGRRGPRVLIDEAHWNIYTANGRYQPFANLLTRDGFRVSRGKQPFTKEQLASTDILVIAGATGLAGRVQQVLSGVRLPVNVFSDKEVTAVRDWVTNGGALLLTDSPALADQFGITALSGKQEIREELGGGRVVAVADAAMLTAQRATLDGREIRWGINDSKSDNQTRALGLMRWLARAN